LPRATLKRSTRKTMRPCSKTARESYTFRSMTIADEQTQHQTSLRREPRTRRYPKRHNCSAPMVSAPGRRISRLEADRGGHLGQGVSSPLYHCRLLTRRDGHGTHSSLSAGQRPPPLPMARRTIITACTLST
jgi:hypothetical protein